MILEPFGIRAETEQCRSVQVAMQRGNEIMKSVRLHGTGDLQLHDEPVPVAAAGEKLVRVRSVGVCGSDLHWFSEGSIGDAKLERPLVLGHEFAGETEDGQRVAIDPAIPCGRCEFCEQGHPNLCSNLIFAGHGKHDGALREWMAWNQKSVFPIPDSISDADGAMLEPLGVAIHTVDLGKIKAGMTVGCVRLRADRSCSSSRWRSFRARQISLPQTNSHIAWKRQKHSGQHTPF
jgi:D-arabinose 1-dehydrogenase-like Zn-dependent alcohol dehydrogenase